MNARIDIQRYDVLEDKVISMKPGEQIVIGFIRHSEPISVPLAVIAHDFIVGS
ncbi:hypothetical protein P4H39_25180 [Paenibacillus lautus]|uniref:hypothetical protein n=1 Tax=Paenibacillus lautus TaxID=1401 RepID=UPI002DBEEC92|nr:hypothetical protein [Paenibacillus lautus]MEC0205907.1 hypothetical protein [Paenibacillus lautus]